MYNEDPLADALGERLDKLTALQVKWTPEILHLLLELSDQPVSKSKLERLHFLKQPEPDAGPILKWKDLVAEDPLLREKSVWRNVDFAAEDCITRARGRTGQNANCTQRNAKTACK